MVQVQPSASCVCYLFADRVIKRLTLGQRINGEPAVAVPSSGHLVLLGLLERMLLAVAIWSLQVSDHITVMRSGRQADADGEWKSGDRLVVHRTAPTAVPGGLEGELFAALGDRESDLYRLIRDQWLRGEKLLWNGIIVVAQREAISAGVLYPASSPQRLPRSLQWSQSLPNYVADPERLDALEAAFSELDDGLARFAHTDRDLWKRLLAESGQAIAAARPRPSMSAPQFDVPSGGA